MEGQSFNIDIFKFDYGSDPGLPDIKIEIIAHITDNNTMIPLGINIYILNINTLIFAPEYPQKVIFASIRQLIQFKLWINPRSPPINPIALSDDYFGLLRDNEFLYLLVSGQTWQLDLFENEDVLLSLHPLLETSLVYVGLLIIIQGLIVIVVGITLILVIVPECAPTPILIIILILHIATWV